jgi:ubiquinone/menaquinone biosynthesis C-methylase UbiE
VPPAGDQGSHADAVRSRFSQTAAAVGRCSDDRAEQLATRVRHLVELTGDERALDAGAGTGALAFALSPLVREVVAVELVPELLEEGRKRLDQHPNVTFVEGDVTALPFPDGWFDVSATRNVLHHVARPELALAELARVTRLGGTLLVIDQVAPIDPLEALELDRFERARDPSHTRVLSDQDFRGAFESNSLVLTHSELVQEERALDAYLDLAGCFGDEREQAAAMAPGRGSYTATIGWYVLERRPYGG